MRLSTSTNIMDRYLKVQNKVTPEECIKACAKAGYKVLDMNFCDMGNPGMPLTFDNWQEWVHSIKALGDELGLEFSQTHSVFYDIGDKTLDGIAWRDELVRRSIIASGIIGAKWVVLHPGSIESNGMSPEQSIKANVEYFTPYVKLAKENGVGIALENLPDFARQNGRRFGGTVAEIIDLVDAFNDDAVGVCWDFGHANIMGCNQAEALRAIGNRLVAVHVQDNYGVNDDHLAPFYGTIDWPVIMKTLKEINYKYDFTYEIHNFTDRVPLELRDICLEYSVKIGEYLISLAK